MNKVYTENININLKDVENVEKKLIQQRKIKNLTFKWAFHSSEVSNSASHKKQW